MIPETLAADAALALEKLGVAAETVRRGYYSQTRRWVPAVHIPDTAGVAAARAVRHVQLLAREAVHLPTARIFRVVYATGLRVHPRELAVLDDAGVPLPVFARLKTWCRTARPAEMRPAA